MVRAHRWCFAVSAAGLAIALLPGSPAIAAQTTRVSVASDGSEANGSSSRPDISADGRFVAFTSNASNLVDGDTNGKNDVFVHDRLTGQTVRISVASNGSQGNDHSYLPLNAISADGRFIIFNSLASNLVDGDTNGYGDVFIHDRHTGETTRVSVASDGAQGNLWSYSGAISGDGSIVAFGSDASNLVSGDTNGYGDIFVHDRKTGKTTRVSVASDGTQADNVNGHADISSDGRFVAFPSWSSTFAPGYYDLNFEEYVHDRLTGETTLVSLSADGRPLHSEGMYTSISANGQFIAFQSRWIYIFDRQKGYAESVVYRGQ